MDEKVDPFMRRWALPELEELNPPSGGGEEQDDPIYKAVPSTADLAEGFNFTPKKLEHLVTCDCNPCTCAVNEEMANDPRFSTVKVILNFFLL